MATVEDIMRLMQQGQGAAGYVDRPELAQILSGQNAVGVGDPSMLRQAAPQQQMQGVDPFAQMLVPQAQASVAPQSQAAPQAPMQQAAVPQAGAEAGPQMTPPATPEEYNARVSAWGPTLEKIQSPEVMGPLMTFLTAIAAPLGLGESVGARIGRAGMLASLHKSMIEENRQTQEAKAQQEQMAQEKHTADMARSEADVARTGADTRRISGEADYAEATFGTRVNTAKQNYENAVMAGDERNVKLGEAKLAAALGKEFDRPTAKANLDKIVQETKLRAAQTAKTWRDAKEPYAVPGGAGGGASGTKPEDVRKAQDRYAGATSLFKQLKQAGKVDVASLDACYADPKCTFFMGDYDAKTIITDRQTLERNGLLTAPTQSATGPQPAKVMTTDELRAAVDSAKKGREAKAAAPSASSTPSLSPTKPAASSIDKFVANSNRIKEIDALLTSTANYDPGVRERLTAEKLALQRQLHGRTLLQDWSK